MNNNGLHNKLQFLLKRGYFSYSAALLSVIILPIHVWYLPPFMILWGLVWIVENYSNFNLIRGIRTSYMVLFFLFISFYAWEAAGLIYTENLSLGLGNLFSRLSFLLFPLVLILPGEMIKIKAKLLIRIFALSTFLFIVFCFCYALFRSVSFQNGLLAFNSVPADYPWLNYFFGSYLTITQHPSYIALYVLLSAIISFEAGFDHSLILRKRICWIFPGIMMLTTIYFLSSRGGVLIGLASVLLYFIVKFGRFGKMKQFSLVVVLIIIIVSPVLVNTQRLNSIYSIFLSKQANEKNTRDPRLVIWKSGLNTSRKNLLIGVGIGDVRTELANEYSRIGEVKMAEEKLNAHNQFLEVLIENGIIGLILFISIIICMSYIAISDKNLLYGLFILIIIMFFQFESILCRLAGVTFFSLFSFLMIYIDSGIFNKEAGY